MNPRKHYKREYKGDAYCGYPLTLSFLKDEYVSVYLNSLILHGQNITNKYILSTCDAGVILNNLNFVKMESVLLNFNNNPTTRILLDFWRGVFWRGVFGGLFFGGVFFGGVFGVQRI